MHFGSENLWQGRKKTMPLMVIQIGPNEYGDLAFTATSLFDGERGIYK